MKVRLTRYVPELKRGPGGPYDIPQRDASILIKLGDAQDWPDTDEEIAAQAQAAAAVSYAPQILQPSQRQQVLANLSLSQSSETPDGLASRITALEGDVYALQAGGGGAGGSATPVLGTISGGVIDLGSGTFFKDAITANTTRTLYGAADMIEGEERTLFVTSSGSFTYAITGAVFESAVTLAAGKVHQLKLHKAYGIVAVRQVTSGGWTLDVTDPAISSASIDNTGGVLTVNFPESVEYGAGGSGGFALSGGQTLTYSAGAGTGTLTYSISPVVQAGASLTLAFTQPGNGWRDMSGNTLKNVSGVAVTNNSVSSSYLMTEGFEEVNSGGAAGSSTDGFDSPYAIAPNVQGTGSSANNKDTTMPSGRVGAYNLKLTNATTGWVQQTWVLPQSYDELWVKLRIHGTGLYSFNAPIIALNDAGGVIRLSLNIASTGGKLRGNFNGFGVNSLYAFSSATTYYVWLHFKKNGTSGVYISTTDVRPTVDASSNSAMVESTGYNGQVRQLTIGTPVSQAIVYFVDDIKIAATEIA